MPRPDYHHKSFPLPQLIVINTCWPSPEWARQELVGILNMPQNKRMRKAGITESHLAILADVYKEVVGNAITRNQEDTAGIGGPLGISAPNNVDKGVRVARFTTTLGIPPFLFMREVIQPPHTVLLGLGETSC